MLGVRLGLNADAGDPVAKVCLGRIADMAGRSD